MMGARGSWHRHAPRLFVHPCRLLDGGSGGRQGYSARVKSTVPISVPLPAPANGTGVTARPCLGTCTRGLGGSENGLGQVPREGKLWSVAGEGQARTLLWTLPPTSALHLCNWPMEHGWMQPALHWPRGLGAAPSLPQFPHCRTRLAARSWLAGRGVNGINSCGSHTVDEARGGGTRTRQEAGGIPERHGCTHALPRALLSPGAIAGPHPSTRPAMGTKLPGVCSRGYGQQDPDPSAHPAMGTGDAQEGGCQWCQDPQRAAGASSPAALPCCPRAL